MKAKPITKQASRILLIFLLGLFLSSCAIPMKESESSAEKTTPAAAEQETEAPEVPAEPRLKYIVNSDSVQELIYDSLGQVCRRITRQIGTSGDTSWLETETVFFDADGNVTDYRIEGVPEAQRDPDQQIRMEGKRLIRTSKDSTVTYEYENGQLVLFLINASYYNVIAQYERDGNGQCVRRTVQQYETDAADPEKKTYFPAQVYQFRYAYDEAGLPLYSWQESEDGVQTSAFTVYYYENHPARQKEAAGRLKAVLSSDSVTLLTCDPDGTVRQSERLYLDDRCAGSSTEYGQVKETISFDRNGDLLLYRREGDPNGEDGICEISGNQLTRDVFRLTYRQGRVSVSKLSISYGNDTVLNRDIVYSMDSFGLYEKRNLSWYLTKQGDPDGEKQSAPGFTDSEEKFVYLYETQRFPLWSYRVNEKGEPVRDSFELYIFE
ncbi:MAG: hypothetical protein J5496_01855 [Lachnospiraceae bacterium]|nr:hypothetical protein [Lachnospiraceae bacterium]